MVSFVDMNWNNDKYYNKWLEELFTNNPDLVYEALRTIGHDDEFATKNCENKEYFNVFKSVVSIMWWENNIYDVQGRYEEYLKEIGESLKESMK